MGLTSLTSNTDQSLLKDEFIKSLRELRETPLQIESLQLSIYGIASQLLQSPEGLLFLYEQASDFDEYGMFKGRPWEDPSKLQVSLVAGTLRGPDPLPVIETLSELRILTIAMNKNTKSSLPQEEAIIFLDEMVARNLRFLFPSNDQTEAERVGNNAYKESNQRLLELIIQERGIENALKEILFEIEQVLIQRPISTLPVRRMIARAYKLAHQGGIESSETKRLQELLKAANGPSPLSQSKPELTQYRKELKSASEDELQKEAHAFAQSMKQTGLAAPYHGILVQHLAHENSQLLRVALGTNDAGDVEISKNQELIYKLIKAAVFATTAQSIYGLSLALNRVLLSRPEVAAGLEKLIDLEIKPDVQENLLFHRSEDDNATASGVLLSGVLAALGQPLGIGQGRNPTCQSARGISLWAQYDPAHLIKLVVSAARDGQIKILFQGHMVQSEHLPQGVAATLDLDLDPISIVLVPHLDRIYSEFMRRSILRLEDAHKWVNPALYGHWVPHELSTPFADVTQTVVSKFNEFARCFYATHHPDYNGGLQLMYPNPVGLIITNHHGKYLGPHAVSIQRVAKTLDGQTRVYFFNPNNEGRQDWGHGVFATVQNHGEVSGESSLPFDDFLARLYAFHYNPNEQGELEVIPESKLKEVTDSAKNSWGDNFIWLQ